MIVPGEKIEVDSKTLEGLGIELSAVVDDLETSYSRLFKDIETHWRWYEARPASPGPKNFPFKGASNVVVPLIQIMVDTFVNRVYASIFAHGPRVWSTSTEREDQEQAVKDVGRWINWASNDNDFSIRLPAYDQILEMAVVGSSVMALNWRSDVRWAYAPGKNGKLRTQEVRYARGAFPEHIPRELILWDTNHLIQEAPVVCREFRKRWTQLRNMASLDPSWNMKEILAIQGRGGGGEGPSQQVRDSKDVEDTRDITARERLQEHDIREVHLEWPMLDQMGFSHDKVTRPGDEGEDTPSPPIVATFDRKSRKILRLIAEPYFFPYKPFFDIFYRKRSGRGHSAGIAKKLEHMQRSMTTSLNQAHDARTRANAVWARTKRRDMLNKPLDPSTMIYDPDMASVEPFNLGPSGTFDDARLMTIVNTIAERQTGMSDPAMGRETRQGGHPSPATSTLALLEQSEIMQGTTRELIRSQYSRLGEGIASLYQQFETNEDGKLQRVLGDADAGRVETFMFPTDPISGTLAFDVTAMSGSNTPEAEMKRAILVSQMNQNYWISVIQGLGLMENPQTPPLVKQAIMEGIKAGTKSQMRFLEAGDVDDLERYVLSLAASNDAGTDDLRTATNRAREIAGGSLGTQVPGVGGPGGLPTNGAAGPPQPVGGFQ